MKVSLYLYEIRSLASTRAVFHHAIYSANDVTNSLAMQGADKIEPFIGPVVLIIIALAFFGSLVWNKSLIAFFVIFFH